MLLHTFLLPDNESLSASLYEEIMKGNMEVQIQALFLALHTSCSTLWKSRFCNNLQQGKVHQCIIQSQMVSHENTHKSNIVQTEWVVFMYFKYICTYMHVTMKQQLLKEKVKNFKQNIMVLKVTF